MQQWQQRQLQTQCLPLPLPLLQAVRPLLPYLWLVVWLPLQTLVKMGHLQQLHWCVAAEAWPALPSLHHSPSEVL